MTTADDVRQQIDYVYALAYGRARITAAAEAANASLGIDDTALQLEAHQLLVEAYVQGSERWKAMAPFSWCLALYKNHPEYFDEERLDTLRWQYKWIIEMVCKNPDIKRSQIESLFKQFSDFYHEQGLSSHTVYGIGVWMYQSLGELDLAYEQLTSWRATPTDEFSDCPACDLQIQVDYATAVEDWQLADACDIDALERAGAETCDVIVAATGDDKANLVISLLAKTEYGVPRTVARVNNPKSEWLFDETWGVDVAVSTPRFMTALVEEAVSVGSLVSIFHFHQSGASMHELTLPEDSPVIGELVTDIELPPHTVLAAILRDYRPITPDRDERFERGDELIFLTAREGESSLEELPLIFT